MLPPQEDFSSKVENTKNLPPFNLAFDDLTIQLHDNIRITCPLKARNKTTRKGKHEVYRQ